MVKFGTPEWDGATPYSPTKDFMKQSATAGLPQYTPPASPGGSRVSTPEEALERRPYMNTGKTSLSLYSGRSATAMAPVAPAVQMPTIPQEQIKPVEAGPLDWVQTFLGAISPILAPGSGQVTASMKTVSAWNEALNSDDEIIRNLALEWKAKAESNEISAYEAIRSFYDQYVRVEARRKGQSAELTQSLTPQLLPQRGDIGQTAGAMLGEIFKPAIVLQQGVVRSMSGGIDGLTADRVEETLRTPDEKLTPGLVALKESYKAGEINEDEFRDLIIIEGFGLTNPDPLGTGTPLHTVGNMGVSLVLEVLSDPLSIPSLGAGTLAQIGGMAGRRVVPGVVRSVGQSLVTDAGTATGEAALKTAMKGFSEHIDEVAMRLRATNQSGINQMDRIEAIGWIARNEPQYAAAINAGFSQSPVLSTVAMRAPKIVRAGMAVDRALDPMTLVGRTAGAIRARLAMSNLYAEGFYDALGWGNVHKVDDTLRSLGIDDPVIDALTGRAAANHALQIGNNTAMRRMKASGQPGTVNGMTPTDVAQAAVEMAGGDVRKLMARQVDSTSEYIVPTGRGGISAGLAAWREQAARMLSDLGATGDVDAAAAKLSENEIRYLKHLYWAFQIEQIDTAKRAAMPTDKFTDEMIDRVTMLGARQLTEARRVALIAAIERGNVTEIRRAVQQYDDLTVNVSLAQGDDDLMRQVDNILRALDGRVPTALTGDDLPDALKDYLTRYGDRGYQLGLRPEDADLASVIKDVDGNVIGVRSWIDNVVDATPADRVGKLRSVWQDLTRGISGAAIELNAQRRFIQQIAETSGVSEADATEIMRNVRRIANEQGTTPRGLSVQALERAVIEAKHIDPSITKQARRSIVDNIMWAYQNEMRLVGVTQRFTGEFKTRLGTWDNWIGRIAEDLYPKIRFTWSPIFIAQEMTEYPYFMILRGKYPMRAGLSGLTPGGVLFKEQRLAKEAYDAKTRFLMDYFAEGSNYVASDMIEQSDLVRRGFGVAQRIANRKTPLGKVFERGVRLISEKTNLVERKANAEAVIYRARMGDELRKMMMEEAPSTWNAVRAFYPKEMSDGEVAVEWLYDLVARNDPESVWNKVSPQFFRPSHLGRRALFSPRLVGYLVGGEDGADLSTDMLRRRIASPSDALDFNYIEQTLRTAGADNDYIERARWSLIGPTADEFYASLETLGVSPEQALGMRRADQIAAERANLGLNDYLAARWAEAPQSVDQFGDQRGTFAFQLIVDSLEARGLVAPDRASPLLRDLTDMGKGMVPEWAKYADVPAGTKIKDLPKEQQAARSKYVGWVGARERRAADPTLGTPPSGANGDPLYAGRTHTFGRPTYDQWLRQLEETFPDENTRREYADWYTDMQRGFLALFSDMPEAQVENAARMIVAFGVTQLNTSPALGMEFLYRVMSMARRGEDWPSVLGLTPSEAARVKQASGGLNFGQLESILMERGTGKVVPAGLGQKLADFIDSLIGNRERSVGIAGPNPDRPWMPVAGDVWAKRDLGFIDPKIGSEMWRVVDGGASSKVVGDIKKDPKTGKPVLDEDGDPVYAKVDRIEVYDESGKVIQTFSGDAIGDSVPTNLEYDYIVEYYNGLADFLNERHYLNRTWTAADVQAVGWFRAKRVFGDDTGDVRSAIYKGRWGVQSEIGPAAGVHPADLWPGAEYLSPDSARFLNDELTQVAHTAAMDDAGVITPRAAGTRYWDGKPVAYDRTTGHYTVNLGSAIDPDTGAPIPGTGGRYSRGRVVSGAEKERVRARGEAIMGREFATSPLTYATENATQMADDLHAAVTPSRNGGDMWGGATIDPRTGGKVDITRGIPYSSAIADTVELPGDATLDEITVALNDFLAANSEALSREDHYVGIFRDDSKGTIELDVNFVVYSEFDAEAVQTYLERTGGAYNFDTGNGVYAAITQDEIAKGKNTVSGFRIGNDGEVIETPVVEVLGDRSAAEQYAARLGYYSKMDEVVLIRDTNVTVLDYGNKKGKGNIGGVVRVAVRTPEEGADLLRKIAAGVGAFPKKGAHLAQGDDGTWFVQALWEPEAGKKADGGAFKRATKTVDDEVRQMLGRPVAVERGPVEFIRVSNDWAAKPDGGDYLGVIGAPSHTVRKFGERPATPSPAAGSVERSRLDELASRAEDIIQRTVPREAAASRTDSLYAGAISDTGTGRVRSADDILRASDGVQYQRAPAGTRAAIVRAADGRRASLYLGSATAGVTPDSLLHEMAHKFAWDLEPSAIRRIKGVKASHEGTPPGTRGRHAYRLTTDDQEWFVDQFLLWANDPNSVHVTLHPLLEAFRRDVYEAGAPLREATAAVTAAQKALDDANLPGSRATPAEKARLTVELNQATARLRTMGPATDIGQRSRGGQLAPEMKQFFDDMGQISGRENAHATWDMDEDLMFQWADVAHRRSSRSAKDLVNFRSDRSLIERSLNHPFFGLYPLSYMYGKVLPELVEFLMFRPFGFKAPGIAFNTTNRMFQSYMNQQEHDEDLREYLYENEPAMRALAMFIPGVPWDLPVNAPLWWRRWVEAMSENHAREVRGEEPKEIDLGKIISDVMGYQFGVGRSAQQFGQTAEGLAKIPEIAGRVLAGEEIAPTGEGTELGGPFVAPAEPAPEPTGTLQPEINIGPATIQAGEIEAELNQQIIDLERRLGGAVE